MTTNNESARRPAALIILDGWGYAPAGPGNAISLADTPVWDSLWSEYPHVLLEASGEAVGLPPGVMGNSEVGHLTLGSGRIIYQDLSRINRAIANGSVLRERGARRHSCSRCASVTVPCISWACSPTRACTRSWATSRRW